ncbi:response regulator transcription factor [Nesterenkonia halobia]|uniref:Response regulator transcription factor n=1 Tax=Nesterenkonia halobia TaxID=37922 RepID=A0ABP6R6F3_9MICC
MQISVVAVDDDPLVLGSLQNILVPEEDVSVLGTAGTGQEAVAAVRAHQPDVVLMDLHLRGALDGVETTRRLRRQLTPPAVLAVTSFDTDRYLRGALDAGATGFLLKTDAPDLLATAIRMTHDGDPMISPAMTSRLIASYVTPTTDRVCQDARHQVTGLADRELQVAGLIGGGKTYQDIAETLHLSPSTVKSTVRRAMDKVGADTGAHLAVIVAQARLDVADGR